MSYEAMPARAGPPILCDEAEVIFVIVLCHAALLFFIFVFDLVFIERLGRAAASRFFGAGLLFGCDALGFSWGGPLGSLDRGHGHADCCHRRKV